MFSHPTYLDRLVVRLITAVTPGARGYDPLPASRSVDPETLFASIGALGFTWLLAYALLSLLWLGIWAVLRGVDVVTHHAFLPVFEFMAGFCIAGSVDAFWRYLVASAARKRFIGAGETVDHRTSRLMNIAQINDATILIQLAVGVLVVLHPH